MFEWIDSAEKMREISSHAFRNMVYQCIQDAADIGLSGVEIETDHCAPDHIEDVIARLSGLGYDVTKPGFQTLYVSWGGKNVML